MFEKKQPQNRCQIKNRFDLHTSLTLQVGLPARVTFFPLLVFIVLIMAGCSDPVPAEDTAVELGEPRRIEKSSTEFVVCIDNSRSIKPPEQVLIREATMLLADLADPGDRISVTTFGEDARVVVSTDIQSDSDRRSFKQTVQEQVDFGENYSDIRAGLRLLAEQREQLFPSADNIHAAILFSDGRLEPKDGDTEGAFRQIQTDLEDTLAGLELYAVVLGETYSQRPIDKLGFNGQTLMQQHIARSPRYFYHAKQLDQLFEVAVLILKKTKGISSLGEESGDRFRIDSTVQSMTLIVRKRTDQDGADTGLPLAEEIRLVAPETGETVGAGNSGRGPESIYRNSDYRHFDLFVVRNPRSGIWSVALDGGQSPVVLSKIDTPVNLMVEAGDGYFRNEVDSMRTWLANAQTGMVERGAYRLRARVAPPGQLAASETYVVMARDEASGQFFLTMPDGLRQAFTGDELPDSLAIEIVAQSDEDPWFLRRSEPFEIAFYPPLIQWQLPGPVVRRLPLLDNMLDFGGAFDEALYREQGFEVPPMLTLTVERYDEKSAEYLPWYEITKEVVVEENAHRFPMAVNVAANGLYRYGYRLDGNTGAGLLKVRSPWFTLHVEWNWPLLAATGVVLLLLIHLFGSMMARLRGQVQIDVTGPMPGFTTAAVRPRRTFDSVSVRDIDLGAIRFKVEAKRYLLVVKRLKFRLLAGSATVDKQVVRSGDSRLLKAHGRHEVTISDDEGREVTVDMMLR